MKSLIFIALSLFCVCQLAAQDQELAWSKLASGVWVARAALKIG